MPTKTALTLADSGADFSDGLLDGAADLWTALAYLAGALSLAGCRCWGQLATGFFSTGCSSLSQLLFSIL
jgi:hypothetical protein